MKIFPPVGPSVIVLKESQSEVAQSCLTLWDSMDCSPPGFSIHGVFRARILEWVAISFSRGSFPPRGRTQVSRIEGRCFTLWEWEYHSIAAAKSLQSCPTLCDPIDSRPPGFPVPGILQARTLEWVAISFSRASFPPWDPTQVSHIEGRCFTFSATRERECHRIVTY